MENENLVYEEEEEEAREEEPQTNTIQGTNSNVSLLKSLFTNDAKSFSLRKDDKEELVVAPVKDWKQISYDFLSCRNDLQPLGPMDSYALIDTTRSEEFAAGQGTPNWGNLRRIALDDSKEKKKRVRK